MAAAKSSAEVVLVSPSKSGGNEPFIADRFRANFSADGPAPKGGFCSKLVDFICFPCDAFRERYTATGRFVSFDGHLDPGRDKWISNSHLHPDYVQQRDVEPARPGKDHNRALSSPL